MTNEQDFRKNNNNQEQSLHFSFLFKPLKDFFAVTEVIFAGKDKLIISPSTFYCSLHIHFVSWIFWALIKEMGIRLTKYKRYASILNK